MVLEEAVVTVWAVLFLLIVVALSIATGVICILKAKYWTFVAGLFLGIFWVVGAIRLAEPNSWWARHRYDEAELARAVSRYER